MLKFDPCGHTLSLESFVFGVEQAFGGGSAKHEIRASTLGTFCLTCPVRDPEKPCGQSFVHDVHHYKLAVRAQKTAPLPLLLLLRLDLLQLVPDTYCFPPQGRAAYDRIKTYGLEASGFGGPAGGGAAGGGGAPAAVAEGVPPNPVVRAHPPRIVLQCLA